MEYIAINWEALGISIRAELLRSINPIICEKFYESLPYKSIQSHAVVAGGQMYCPYRLIVDAKDCNTENMAAQAMGRINMELDFQYLSINYGEITEAVPAVAILQVVDEDIDKLRDIGQRVWENLLNNNDYIVVSFEYLGGDIHE